MRITKKQIKSQLEELTNICGEGSPTLSDCSIEYILEYLRMAMIYRRFDLEAVKRELANERRSTA